MNRSAAGTAPNMIGLRFRPMWLFPLLLLLLTSSLSLAARPALLVAGPMVAWSAPYEAAIWLQTRAAARARIHVWPLERPAVVTLSREVATSPEGDHLALVPLEGLEPDRRYGYRLELDGQRVELGHPASFRTPPAQKPPLHGAVDFRFALGSCYYRNDPRRDWPGKPYGDGYPIFSSIHAKAPDFMVWLGDTTYLRSGEWQAESSMRERFRFDRAADFLRPLLANSAHYAMWDDHDYGPNNADAAFPLKRKALEVFSDYWPAQDMGVAGVPGIYRSFTWGDVELFLTDGRYHRNPEDLVETRGKGMLGPVQLEWLTQGLAASQATFKIVCTGTQAFNPLCRFESWGHYPEERQAFLDFLARQPVDGVVFLSGDRHASELLRWERPGSYPLYEFTCSSLTSGPHRNEAEAGNPNRVAGTWVAGQRNFGLVEVRGDRGARRLVLATFDTEGRELWRREITQAELRAPRPLEP